MEKIGEKLAMESEKQKTYNLINEIVKRSRSDSQTEMKQPTKYLTNTWKAFNSNFGIGKAII